MPTGRLSNTLKWRGAADLHLRAARQVRGRDLRWTDGNPVQIHSHGGRVKLIQSGELNIDVAFLGVPCCDEFGNANGFSGKSRCGSLGYAQVDAQYAKCVVLLTEEWVEFPNYPASIAQDQVD